MMKHGGEDLLQGRQFGIENMEEDTRYNELTRTNMRKVVQFGGLEKRQKLLDMARDHLYRLKAEATLHGSYRVDESKLENLKDNAPRGRLLTKPRSGDRTRAGQEYEGQPTPLPGKRRNSVIRLSRGVFAKRLNSRATPPASTKQAKVRALRA